MSEESLRLWVMYDAWAVAHGRKASDGVPQALRRWRWGQGRGVEVDAGAAGGGVEEQAGGGVARLAMAARVLGGGLVSDSRVVMTVMPWR